ncbi:hypothetical protein CDAR_456941 [Caerostris darwini]|uniref:RNase NYN domain-containing protein n=1 Tax=Caerostris darwini TaxID=1538125 RepID=A0AAV4T6V6_9ARAC|nr:hypothetical protein CDAR_456941 [Caerostris darwini]
MENIILSPNEQKLLIEFKEQLESSYTLTICMPAIKDTSICKNDVIIATILGEEKNISVVKDFLKKKMDEQRCVEEQSVSYVDNIPVITLTDDSDSDIPNETLIDIKQKQRKRQKLHKNSSGQAKDSQIELEEFNSSIIILNDNDENSSLTMTDSKKRKMESTAPLPNFIPLNRGKNKFVSQNRRKKEENSNLISLINEEEEVTNSVPVNNEKKKENTNFIPLNNAQKKEIIESLHQKKEITKSVPLNSEENTNVIPLNAIEKKDMVESLHEKDDIIILDKVECVSKVPTFVPEVLRCLRPIVIHGNNVALTHGRRTTFSCKGIKIAVEFFLKRGHEVTAFALEFRRFAKSTSVPTTDQSLLDQLQKDGHLVFIPSRKVQDKRFSCYENWFVVDLASRTGGVILSNGNFKDVVQKNEEFRQVVEERLLMYCFVGDEFMIPPDPLGRYGPKLEEFLSFPPSEAPSI